MVEKYLGDEQASDIFLSSMLSRLMTEKQASDFIGVMEKASAGGGIATDLAKIFGNAGKGLRGIFGTGIDFAKFLPSSLGWTAALGAGSGVLGASAYDIIKERTSHEDPEAQLNEDIEAMYNSKSREKNDSKWMARVRRMRDELRRGYKKMSVDEYAKKYNELIDALDERKATA